MDREKWMDTVLREIRFIPDRKKIRQELLEHMADRMEDYEDEEQVLLAMGDPSELGQELNREHKPWIGWIWLGSWAILAVTACCALVLSLLVGLSALADRQETLDLEETYGTRIKYYDQEYNHTGDIYYNWQTDYMEEVMDTEITFRNFVYDDFDGRLVVYVTSEGRYALGKNTLHITIDGMQPHMVEHFNGQDEEGQLVGLHILTWERFNRDTQEIIVRFNKFGEGFTFCVDLTSGEVKS